MGAIVNPAAAGGRSARIWRRAERLLHARGIEADAFVSRLAGDGEEQARRALAAGYSTLIAVGGDGTLHEVLNALRHDMAVRDDVRIGVIPAGTGMDFIRNTEAQRGLEAAVDRIARGRERRIDVGVLTTPILKLFVNFAEIGLGASVVARQAAFSSRWPGRASFFLAGIAAAARDDPIAGRVSVDGVTVYDGRLVSLVVANGAYFGGGMKIAPPAHMDDGTFDVVLLGDLSKVDLVSQIWKVYPGIHLKNPQVHWMRGSQIQFEPTVPGHLDLDGELYPGGICHVSVLRAALRILADA